MTTPILPEIWVARDVLRRHWGIEADLSQLALGDNGCAWLCETPTTKYVLKASPMWLPDPLDTYRVWATVGRLCKNTCTFLPTVDSDTPSGDTFVWTNGQWRWTVQHYIEGRGYDGTWQDAELVARQLGDFLRKLEGLGNKWQLPKRTLYQDLSEGEIGQVQGWLLESRDPMASAVLLALKYLETWYGEKKVLCAVVLLKNTGGVRVVHYDLHPDNVRITENNTVVVLDPTLTYANSLHALSFAASRFCPADPARFLVNALEKDLGEGGCKLDLLPRFARAEAIMRINWILRVNCIMGISAWQGDLSKHLKALGVEGV